MLQTSENLLIIILGSGFTELQFPLVFILSFQRNCHSVNPDPNPS